MNVEMDSVPKYVINFDEFMGFFRSDLSRLISKALGDRYPNLSTNNLEAMLEDMKRLLPYEIYRGITHTIDLIINNSTLSGMQKVEGRLLDVPPIIQRVSEVFQFDRDIYITGLHFNQTGWKKNDTYSLVSNKNTLINNSFTKEVGEHKCFNTFFPVYANTPIEFILDNKSGNSRQTMIDLEYIDKKDPIVPRPPEPPNTIDVDDIKNEWDVAVVMNWEEGSADIDLHGFIDTKHVWYKNSNEEGFYLNFDFRSHLSNTNPEILSVKGYRGSHLDVYMHNYNHTKLNQPVNIKIYSKDRFGPRVIKEYNVNLANDNTYLLGVCSIDLNTLIITDLNNQKTP